METQVIARYGRVAQLGERLLGRQEGVGSIPITSTRKEVKDVKESKEGGEEQAS